MSLLQRVLEPAKSLTELLASDEVYRHATRNTTVANPSRKARAVVKCNQLTTTGGRCDWTTSLEARAGDIERIAKRTLYVHLGFAHPYLTATHGSARRIARDAWVTLSDFSR